MKKSANAAISRQKLRLISAVFPCSSSPSSSVHRGLYGIHTNYYARNITSSDNELDYCKCTNSIICNLHLCLHMRIIALPLTSGSRCCRVPGSMKSLSELETEA